MGEEITQLGEVLDDNIYTAALYGSDMMGEGGFIGIRKQDKVYDIENWYGYGVKKMCTSAFYNIHPEQFFKFYKEEIPHNASGDITSGPALAAMKRAGELQYIIDSNVCDKTRGDSCRHIINLHGSIYQNQCPRCKKKYPIGYMAGTKRVPICRDCSVPIRPMISLIGGVVSSQNMTRTTGKITKADTLLLLGTTLTFEVFCQYIQYFAGRSMTIIHKQEHYLDKGANLVILDHSINVLPQLGYEEEKTEE